MAYTLDTNIDLGNVKRERQRKEADIDVWRMPLSDSNLALAFDFNGMLRRITVEGVYQDTSKANLMDNFIVPIETLLDGNQTAVVYHSDLVDESTSGNYTDGNINVYLENFEWDYVAGEVLKIVYRITLVEASG